jgi:hypothetical protein
MRVTIVLNVKVASMCNQELSQTKKCYCIGNQQRAAQGSACVFCLPSPVFSVEERWVTLGTGAILNIQFSAVPSEKNSGSPRSFLSVP